MKTKHLFLITVITAPIFAVLRILQSIFIIDKNGCYTNGGLFASSLYLLCALAAVFALVYVLKSSRAYIDGVLFTHIPATGILFLLLSAVQLFVSGNALGITIKSGEFSILSVLCLLSALFFAIYGMTVITGKKPNVATSVLGVFPPIYVVAIGINTFFQSFEAANAGYIKFKMLTVCAMALMLFCISASLAGVKIKLRRYSALAFLFTVYASVSSVGELYMLFTSSLPIDEVLFIAQQLILIPIALITLYRAREKQTLNTDTYDGTVDIGEKMNIYIDDIKNEE